MRWICKTLPWQRGDTDLWESKCKEWAHCLSGHFNPSTFLFLKFQTKLVFLLRNRFSGKRQIQDRSKEATWIMVVRCRILFAELTSLRRPLKRFPEGRRKIWYKEISYVSLLLSLRLETVSPGAVLFGVFLSLLSFPVEKDVQSQFWSMKGFTERNN